MPTLTLDYVPLPACVPFHECGAPVTLLRGGVGSGKTKAGSAEALFLALENPGCDGMVVAPTHGILTRTTLRAILDLLPRELLTRHFKLERYLQLINGARIYYGSADRPETLEGATVAWAWGDEIRYWPQAAWDILTARVREPRAQRERIIATSTPNIGWMYDLFGGGVDGHQDIRLRTEDNTYLRPTYLARLKASYSERLYEQYAKGEWVMLEGAVYEEFDEALHVRDLGSPMGPVECWFDPGQRWPHVLLVDVRGDLAYVVDEYCPDGMSTEQLMRHHVLPGYERHGWARGELVVDPAANAVTSVVGYSEIASLEANGWQGLVRTITSPAQRHIRTGVREVSARLKSADGKVRLFFHPRLRDTGGPRGILKCLRGYSYPKRKTGRAQEPVKDDINDHGCDALRYGVVYHWPPDTWNRWGTL